MKRRKIRKIWIILFVLILSYGLYKILLKEHMTTYTVHKYQVKEHFHIENSHHYDFIISKGKKTYTYTLSKNLGKKRKVLTDIKTYHSNNLTCIMPIYKKEIKTTLYCDLENTQVSLDYLIKSENTDFKKIQKKVKEYKLLYPKSSDTKKEYKSIEVYNNNILENQIVYIWNYKGIYILDTNKNNSEKILSYDLYDNVLACTVKDKFVLLENSSVNGIKNIYYYDYSRKKILKSELQKVPSKDSYINGVVDNLIYITDRKEKREYTLNITKGRLNQIDEEETSYVVYQNGKKKVLSKSEFFMQDQLFDQAEYNKKLKQNVKQGDNYYYYQEENKIYRVLKENLKYPILLFEMDDIVEWKVYRGEVIVLKEDTLYFYDDEKGLRKIVTSNELQYNYKNIYHLGEK